uniref:CCT domain-containing protein n=1 Tax=Plectus sambesii TaxID=2011161 RepID=A0A914WHB5_9BILA
MIGSGVSSDAKYLAKYHRAEKNIVSTRRRSQGKRRRFRKTQLADEPTMETPGDGSDSDVVDVDRRPVVARLLVRIVSSGWLPRTSDRNDSDTSGRPRLTTKRPAASASRPHNQPIRALFHQRLSPSAARSSTFSPLHQSCPIRTSNS